MNILIVGVYAHQMREVLSAHPESEALSLFVEPDPALAVSSFFIDKQIDLIINDQASGPILWKLLSGDVWRSTLSICVTDSNHDMVAKYVLAAAKRNEEKSHEQQTSAPGPAAGQRVIHRNAPAAPVRDRAGQPGTNQEAHAGPALAAESR